MVSQRLRKQCRRGGVGKLKPYVWSETAGSRHRKMESTKRKMRPAWTSYKFTHKPENSCTQQTHNLNDVMAKGLFRDNPERHANFILDNCIDDLRDMLYGDTKEEEDDTCEHSIIEDCSNGMDVCEDCGESFKAIINEYSWMDGFISGTHSVSKKHLYKRKTYFLSALRNLFVQSRAATAPKLVVQWARVQQARTAAELLKRMKGAPKLVRTSLKLAKYYRVVHALFNEAEHVRITGIRTDTEDLIMHMYDGCLNAFVATRQQHNRSSFPNKYYVMYQLMRLAKLPISVLNEVPRMSMKSKILEHDEMWSSICENINWPFVPMGI